MALETEKREIAQWLAQQGHSDRDAEKIMQRLERFDLRSLSQSLLRPVEGAESDIRTLVERVQWEIQDENKREMLRWLVEQNRSPREILQVLQRLEDHDDRTIYQSLAEATRQEQEDNADDVLASIVDGVLQESQDLEQPTLLEAMLPLRCSEAVEAESDRLIAGELATELAGLSGDMTCRTAGGSSIRFDLCLSGPSVLERVHPAAARRGNGWRVGVLRASLPAAQLTADGGDADWQAALALRKRLQDLVIVANLAAPGLLEADDGKVFGPDFDLWIPGMSGCLGLARRVLRKQGWPEFRRLPVRAVYDWLIRDGEFLLDGAGKTPLCRALSGLTHLFRSGSRASADQLLYSMAGLEALYTDAADGLQRQLIEKAQFVLGASREFPRQAAAMHQARARVAHGRVAFPPATDSGSPDGATPPLDDAVGQALLISVGVLATTLQRLAAEGWHELRFAWSLVPQPGLTSP